MTVDGTARLPVQATAGVDIPAAGKAQVHVDVDGLVKAKDSTGTTVTPVTGPAGAVDGGLALFNGTTGRILKADGLTPANDDFLQRKAGVWTNRTVALVKTDLGLTGTNSGDVWLNVTSNPYGTVTTAQTAAQNVTGINAILSGAPAGSTIYFPGGTYNFNAAWTMPSKQFVFQGQGANLSGGYTILAWTSNVAGDLITIATSQWYTQFRDITFVSAGVTQSAGAVINVNGNVATNIYRCTFSATGGGFLFDCLSGAGGNGSNSWNTAIVADCVFNNYKNRGIFINSSGSSLIVENCVIQGQWGGTGGTPAAAQAVAGIEGRFVGALQIVATDILGNINNLLMDPVLASSEVCASVFCTNTYFDNAGGSCIKVAGTGATVRAIFAGCSFTTAGTNFTTPGTNLSAVEIGGSFAFAAGGQSISFTDCNILNTFGTTGTSNGVTYTGTSGDTYFTGCKIAGWTNGFNIAASGTNLTNVKILGGAVGPAGGYGANTTGFNVAAGAYKGLQILNVNAHGNTTNLTLGAVTVAAADASLFRIQDNTGINPRGSVTTPGVPTAGTTVTNTTGMRVMVLCKNGATAPASIVLNGVTVPNTSYNNVVTTGTNAFPLDPGGTIAFTTTTVSGWTWVGN